MLRSLVGYYSIYAACRHLHNFTSIVAMFPHGTVGSIPNILSAIVTSISFRDVRRAMCLIHSWDSRMSNVASKGRSSYSIGARPKRRLLRQVLTEMRFELNRNYFSMKWIRVCDRRQALKPAARTSCLLVHRGTSCYRRRTTDFRSSVKLSWPHGRQSLVENRLRKLLVELARPLRPGPCRRPRSG